jgi:hypothetical protein
LADDREIQHNTALINHCGIDKLAAMEIDFSLEDLRGLVKLMKSLKKWSVGAI